MPVGVAYGQVMEIRAVTAAGKTASGSGYRIGGRLVLLFQFFDELADAFQQEFFLFRWEPPSGPVLLGVIESGKEHFFVSCYQGLFFEESFHNGGRLFSVHRQQALIKSDVGRQNRFISQQDMKNS